MREKKDKKCGKNEAPSKEMIEEKNILLLIVSHCFRLSFHQGRFFFRGFLRIPERTGHLYLPRADSSGINLHRIELGVLSRRKIEFEATYNLIVRDN